MSLQRTHIFIYGRVQGVFFRQSTFELAQQLGLSGFVRNRFNGSVEAFFEGDEQKVSEIIEWCNHGPRFASVQGVEVVSNETFSESTSTKKFTSFNIESTL